MYTILLHGITYIIHKCSTAPLSTAYNLILGIATDYIFIALYTVVLILLSAKVKKSGTEQIIYDRLFSKEITVCYHGFFIYSYNIGLGHIIKIEYSLAAYLRSPQMEFQLIIRHYQLPAQFSQIAL